mgnify:CR=1 FL=1
MGLFMIDENKLLAWLKDEYESAKDDYISESEYEYFRGKVTLIQDILIEIKQGRFNGN